MSQNISMQMNIDLVQVFGIGIWDREKNAFSSTEWDVLHIQGDPILEKFSSPPTTKKSNSFFFAFMF